MNIPDGQNGNHTDDMGMAHAGTAGGAIERIDDDSETPEVREFIKIVIDCGQCESNRFLELLAEEDFVLSKEEFKDLTQKLTNMILEASQHLFSHHLSLQEVHALAASIRTIGVRQFNLLFEEYETTHDSRVRFIATLMRRNPKKATA